MNPIARAWSRRALLAFLLLLPLLAAAAETLDDVWLETARNTLQSTQETLAAAQSREIDPAQSAFLKKRVAPLRAQIQRCEREAEAALAKNQQALDLLGSGLSAQSPDLERVHNKLIQEREVMEKRLAACRLLGIQAQELRQTLDGIEQASLTRKLLSKGSNLLQVIRNNLEAPSDWWEIGLGFISTRSGWERLSSAERAVAIFIVLAAWWSGRAWRRNVLARQENHCVDRCTRFLLALRCCSASAIPLIAAAGGSALYLSLALPLAPPPFITQAALALSAYAVLATMVNAAFNPAPPAEAYLPMDASLGRAFATRFKIFLMVSLVSFFFFGHVFKNALSPPQNLLIRSLFGLFLSINLASVLWLAGRLPGILKLKSLRLPLAVALFFLLGADWLGYRNLSEFAFIGLVGTLTGFAVTWFVSVLMADLFDGLNAGNQPWQQALRQRLGLQRDDPLPGLIWIRLLTGAALWGGFGLWTLWLWGLSQRGIETVMSVLREGFPIGSFHVSPPRVALAILVFSLLLAATGWMKRTAVPNWLRHARIDRGARDALIAVTGYVGVTVSALAALSLAGVDFANLAIVAGALSVGIGFGLQNIVNNFVSGLVLLVERPIRTGDWIVVGGTEGYVRRISIRSTQIRTFDHADVIVPNSELVAGQVTNWMLHDAWGRVQVPVGVAYGSNLNQVRDILTAVANAHELVIKESARVAPPTVLITGFGDSAVNLELRCFIRNIDSRMQVFSDLCFAIDEAFRDTGIQIPFPQQDLHVKEWPQRSAT